MLPIRHAQLILQAESPFVGRIDPVRRIELRVGDVVIECASTKEIVSLASWVELNECPFCGKSSQYAKLCAVISYNWPYKLREAINDSFSMDEIHLLCFDLLVNYDELSGNTKSQKVVALIQSLTRRGRLNELFLICEKNRPHIHWAELIASADLHPLEVFKPNAFDPRAGREHLESLNSQATRLKLEGKLGDALQIFQQIKDIDPYYPKIDMNIRHVSYELGRPYVDKYGNVVDRDVYKGESKTLAKPSYQKEEGDLRPRYLRPWSVVVLTALAILIVIFLFYLLSMGYGG